MAFRDFHKCIMFFIKCRNGLAPEYLVELFSSNDTVHMYNTSNASINQCGKDIVNNSCKGRKINLNVIGNHMALIWHRYRETLM